MSQPILSTAVCGSGGRIGSNNGSPGPEGGLGGLPSTLPGIGGGCPKSGVTAGFKTSGGIDIPDVGGIGGLGNLMFGVLFRNSVWLLPIGISLGPIGGGCPPGILPGRFRPPILGGGCPKFGSKGGLGLLGPRLSMSIGLRVPAGRLSMAF